MTPQQTQAVVAELTALLWALALRGERGLTPGWAQSLLNDLHTRHRHWRGGHEHGLAVALWWLWNQVAKRKWTKLQVTSYAAQRAAEERHGSHA